MFVLYSCFFYWRDGDGDGGKGREKGREREIEVKMDKYMDRGEGKYVFLGSWAHRGESSLSFFAL